MKVLFFGDLVGKSARKAFKKIVPLYKKKYGIDFIIANSDNLAHGRGVTEDTLQEVFDSGADLLTCGDHIWDTGQAKDIIESGRYNLICPANLPAVSFERGYKILEVGSKKILVLNLVGRVFFTKSFDCPFRVAEKILNKEGKNADMVILDFHCEATSEKRAMGFYLNSKVSAVLGTHTHIQTSDEEILRGGTAYISDIGMVGPKDSVLGCKKEAVIEQMLTQKPFRYEISDDNDVLVNAVVVEIDKNSGKAKKIQRINEVINIF